MTSKSKSYPGELGKPIPYGHRIAAALRSRENTNSELTAWLDEEISRRFLLLFKHYNIQPEATNPWVRLAYLLALDHVPGLTVGQEGKRGRGRPSIKLPKKLLARQTSPTRNKPGPKAQYSDDDIDAIRKWLPIIKNSPRSQGKPLSNEAMIKLFLEWRAKDCGQTRIPDIQKKVKTVMNRVALRSRVPREKWMPFYCR